MPICPVVLSHSRSALSFCGRNLPAFSSEVSRGAVNGVSGFEGRIESSLSMCVLGALMHFRFKVHNLTGRFGLGEYLDLGFESRLERYSRI